MNLINSKKRVALYIRVSTAEQGEKYGPALQKESMLRWLELHKETHYLVGEHHIFEDIDYSGATPVIQRAALPLLFEKAKAKEFDAVLVYKIDRFFRKTLFLLQAIEELKNYGVGFISTSESGIDTTSPMGQFMIGLLGILAEMERNNILERTASGKQAAALAGRWVGGKTPPYGYDVDPHTKKIAINEEEAEMVRKLFAWATEDRLTTYEIQSRLNVMNLPTKSDKAEQKLLEEGRLKKSSRTTNPANFWNESNIRGILNQPAYTGTYYYGKRSNVKDPQTGKKTMKTNPRETWIPISCPQIIDGVTFRKAAKRLEENEKLAARNSAKEYLLTAQITCGICESNFAGYTKKKQKVVNGEKITIGEYPQYRCGRSNKSKTHTVCTNRQISAEILEGVVWEKILEFVRQPEMFIKRIEEKNSQRIDLKKLQETKLQLEAEMEACNGEKSRAIFLFEKNLAYTGEGDIEKKLSEIDHKIEQLTSQIDVICSQLLSSEEKSTRLMIAKSISKGLYQKTLNSLDFKTKKIIISTLVRNITILPDKISIGFYFEEPKKTSSREDSILETSYGAARRI